MVLPQDFFDPAPTHLPALHVTVDHSRRRKQAAPLRALDASHLPLDEIRPLVFTSVWQQVGAEIVPSPAEASQPARSASAIASTTRVHKIRRAAAQHKHYAFSKLAFDDDVFDVESTTTEGSSNDGDDDASRLRVAKFNIASVVLSKPARERAPKPEPAALPIKKPAEPRSFSSRKVCGCCRTTKYEPWAPVGSLSMRSSSLVLQHSPLEGHWQGSPAVQRLRHPLQEVRPCLRLLLLRPLQVRARKGCLPALHRRVPRARQLPLSPQGPLRGLRRRV
eukprot:m.156509 g.156509  ORF g.156509 m.156509 type:complete len:278 (+) comp52930_c0_seq5:278-1111(+)